MALQAGPFDERYGGTALLEDADLSTRIAALGWRLRYEPDAAVDHLHLGAGGVRADTDSEGPPIALRSRFRNTAYFVRRHRGRVAALNVVPTFLALAVVRSWRAGHPGWVPGLVAAFTAGWREAADTPPLRGIE